MVGVPHLSILRARRGAMSKPDLALLEGVVAPRVLDAMRIASGALTKLGVRHTVVGGLAVGAHGYPRATKDVDFLVGDEAFEHHEGGLVTMKPGVPIQVAGVAIDFLSIGADERDLEAAFAHAIAPAPALAYLKLKSPRSKDRTDLIELVKAGMDVDAVRSDLALHHSDLLSKFDAIVHAARAEEED